MTFKDKVDALECLDKLNKKELKGREMKVEVARSKEPRKQTPGQFKGKHNRFKK